MKAETREKISKARHRYWARLDPERRAEITAKGLIAQKRNNQLHAMRDGRLRSPHQVSTSFVDPDFDEAL